MKLEETVKLHNDQREWKCVDVEVIHVGSKEILMFTLTSGKDEIRLSDHEIEMNRVQGM